MEKYPKLSLRVNSYLYKCKLAHWGHLVQVSPPTEEAIVDSDQNSAEVMASIPQWGGLSFPHDLDHWWPNSNFVGLLSGE